MSLLSLGGFALAMFILAITPGPGVFATVSRALSTGFWNTTPLILGIVVGDLIFLLFAIHGLSAIAENFNALFGLIRYLGSGYLIYLGIKLWRAQGGQLELGPSGRQSGLGGFWGGLSITLGNPKVILFYCGFLPHFMVLEGLAVMDVVAIAVTVSLVLGSVMLFYAYTAARARLLFRSKVAQKRMNRTAGAVLIGTGGILLKGS